MQKRRKSQTTVAMVYDRRKFGVQTLVCSVAVALLIFSTACRSLPKDDNAMLRALCDKSQFVFVAHVVGTGEIQSTGKALILVKKVEVLADGAPKQDKMWVGEKGDPMYLIIPANYGKNHPSVLSLRSKCVFFLSFRQDKGIWEFSDAWFGAQPYSEALSDAVKRISRERMK